ncbi:MAG TPA: squalene synthase HpnC [Bacteroidota bacterium]|nr:squalene synthase HpnC [Bacteroidota bacterium]
MTNAHYENFPVASLFLPEEKRPYIQSIYAFSRSADDFADELDRPPEDRLADLQSWEDMLRACYEGEAEHPVFIALRETVRNLDIPIQPLLDLLSAFRRDVVQNRYETFDDLLSYCRCSANPVGRLVLMIFGSREDELFLLSDHICTALQLTNFWQDVTRDRDKNRLYLPLEDLKRFSVSEGDWKTSQVTENTRKLIRFEVERTRNLFYRGVDLPSRVLPELQLELRLVWFGGMTILKKIEHEKLNVFLQRPRLNTLDKIIVLYRGMFSKHLNKFGRTREEWEALQQQS